MTPNNRIADRLLLACGGIFLLAEVFSGAMRYYLSQLGLSPLIYVPKALLGLVIAMSVLLSILRGRANPVFLVSLLALTGLAIVGELVLQNIAQVAFGFWVLIPLLYGLIAQPAFDRNNERLLPFFLALWVIATSGVLINWYYEWPWVGQAYSLAGVDIESSREWSTAGISFNRLPGFSRASFDAAVQILVFAVLLVTMSRGMRRWILWLISGVAIALTTTKTTMGAFVALTLLLPAMGALPARVLRPIPLMLALIGLALPLLAWSTGLQISTNSEWDTLLFGSIGDRWASTWPESIGLVLRTGTWLFGRGLGGIGTAQQYFEPTRYTATDNVFVYVFGVAGIVGVIGLVIYSIWAGSILKQPRGRWVYFLLTVILLTEGLAINVFESPVLGLIMGASLRVAFALTSREKQFPGGLGGKPS